MPILTFEKYYQKYLRTHPGVSVEHVRRKYDFAHTCMFGVKQLTDAQRRHTFYTSHSEIREVLKPAKEHLAALSLQERTSKTRSGKIMRVSPLIVKRPPKFRKAPALPRPLHQVPLSKRPGYVTISPEDGGECVLYDWMNVILSKFNPLPPGTPLRPVYMQAQTGIYAFGVCGGFSDREPIFAVLLRSPYFRYLHNTSFHVGLLLEQKQIQFREKYIESSLYNHVGRAIADFLDFVLDPHAKVCMVAWSEHQRLIIKDPERDRLVLIDPHGELSNPTDSNFIIERLNIALEILEDSPYKTFVYEPHHQDQLAEGSCATVAFLRALFILFCSNTTGQEPIHFIHERIPCVFALFVSILLQQRGVIKWDEHDEIMAKLHTSEASMAELHDREERLKHLHPLIRSILPLLVRDVQHLVKAVPRVAHRLVTDPVSIVRDVGRFIGPSIARVLPSAKTGRSNDGSAGAGGV